MSADEITVHAVGYDGRAVALTARRSGIDDLGRVVYAVIEPVPLRKVAHWTTPALNRPARVMICGTLAAGREQRMPS